MPALVWRGADEWFGFKKGDHNLALIASSEGNKRKPNGKQGGSKGKADPNQRGAVHFVFKPIT